MSHVTPPEPSTPISPKVIATAVVAGILTVVSAALAAITPDLLVSLGPWAGVAMVAITASAGVIAGWAKRDPLR